MLKTFTRVFWNLLTLSLLIIISVMIWQFATDKWDVNDILDYSIQVMKYGIPITLSIIFLYKMYIEKLIYWWGRIVSGRLITNIIPMSCQKDGRKRSGKDSSTAGEAVLVRETKMKMYKKELSEAPYKLYIYDFDRLNEYLNENSKKFFVPSEKRIKQVFKTMLIENNCFISDYWIKKGVEPKRHLMLWKYGKMKFVPDVPFENGLTPGGQHMLDPLLRYVLIYIRYKFIPNYVMSNQPFIENVEVTKSGKINILYSKVFSQDYFKLKEKTPMPFISGVFIWESETAIFYPNTDKELEHEIKDKTGIREFHTTSGHMLREDGYIRGITQSKTRTNKSLRELYEGYLHVFKINFVCTSDTIRFYYSLRRILLKIKAFYYKKVFIKLVPGNRLKRILHKKIQRIYKKVSIFHQKDLKKWAKGYIVFKIGVYDRIDDSGKRVKFPPFYGLKENKGNSDYLMSGFKQVNKITDCLGRYDTWYMYTVREAKDILSDTHFTDVPNWESLGVDVKNIQRMNYKTFLKLIATTLEVIENLDKEQLKMSNKFYQRIGKPKLPNLIKLETNELLKLCIDFGIDPESFSKVSSTYKADIIKKLAFEYKSMCYKKTKK